MIYYAYEKQQSDGTWRAVDFYACLPVVSRRLIHRLTGLRCRDDVRVRRCGPVSPAEVIIFRFDGEEFSPLNPGVM